MSIKIQISKLTLPHSLEDMMQKIDQAGVDLLPLSFEHITNLGSPPLHHKDPFDRLIISQAQVKNLTVISKDRAFKDYSVKLFWWRVLSSTAFTWALNPLAAFEWIVYWTLSLRF